ncbi:MAG: zf-HC2 domain-containing protein [Candidatus Krumholzibacteria bacterium]|nr:zf-HC2 domain-containing protein [Candidatus Krumholzibacteria bacterium]
MKHVDDKIQAFVAGELSGAELQLVADHVANCPACAREVAEARQLWDLLGEAEMPREMLADVPAASVWPGVQARTFGQARGSLLYGGGRWSKAGIAATALAAGLALAILLPSGDAREKVLASDSDASWGSSFWLDEQSDSGFSTIWLTAVTDGSDS